MSSMKDVIEELKRSIIRLESDLDDFESEVAEQEEEERKSYLLMAKGFGAGIPPKRKLKLAAMRLAIVIDRPADMSESDSVLIALNRLSERDFKDPRERYRLVP